MNRRAILKAAVAAPVVFIRPGALSPTSSDEAAKALRMFTRLGGMAPATTELGDYREQLQYMRAATDDMRVILAMGKRYPECAEPEWLTRAVEAQLGEAMARRRAADIRWHETELRHLKGER